MLGERWRVMSTVELQVKYRYSKFKGNESENILLINVNENIAEFLLYREHSKYHEKFKMQLTKHIEFYEALNNHIASSVQIISISENVRIRVMTNIKCDLWCQHQVKGICNKTEIDIDDMQFSINDGIIPKCGVFDSTKAECNACEHCVEDVCEIDGHLIAADSTCTNGEFESANF